MNIALEQKEEYVNGQLKSKYEVASILGNNVFVDKYTEEKDVETPRRQHFPYLDLYFMSFFFLVLFLT